MKEYFGESREEYLGYRPIEACGVIGDMHTVALVAMDGTIDWCCLPHFDSPSLFARILDKDKGGFFHLGASLPGTNKQMYLPETNILLTRFLSKEGVGEVMDFMPVPLSRAPGGGGKIHQIVRIARAVRGNVHFNLECRPAFDYARAEHTVELIEKGAIFESGGSRVALRAERPLRADGDGVVCEFQLEPGQSAAFVLQYLEGNGTELMDLPLDVPALQERTFQYWRNWMSKCRYEGRWISMVQRSALVLKLLTYEPTGAIVAAPTCSLPEEVGGERNWDYRYTWIRDAAFTVYAFLRLGFKEEAAAFMGWLEQRVQEEERVNGPLNVMYGIDGRHELTEFHLDHLDGYQGSRPVRVGNAAYNQLQLDIYGELLDSVYLFDKHVTQIPYSMWRQLRRMLDWVGRNWELPDQGIWEVRGGRQQFVYSKLMCWVAIDRGLRLASMHSLPIERERLELERDRIFNAIMNKGWDSVGRSFRQHFETNALDAANLLMPLVFFISPKDPRMLSTIDRTIEELASDSLVHRYQIGKGAHDGLSGEEGTFSMCTFWLVEALTRADRLVEARFIFEKMLTYANHLGLYAEEIGRTGEALGNFPQAFTHLGLISAAHNLDRKLRGRAYER